jgi:thiol:disulfide interchange protein DsbD
MDPGRYISKPLKPFLAALLTLFSTAAPAQRDAPVLLAPSAAFRVEASRPATNRLRLEWRIAKGYYLYRNRFRFEIPGGAALQGAEFPAGIIKDDAFFGKSEIYRHRVAVDLPLDAAVASRDPLSIRVVSQGCADLGVCFPPDERILALSTGLPAAGLTGAGFSPTPPAASARDPLAALVGLRGAPGTLEPARAFLPPEKAFALEVALSDPKTLVATWRIADDYYLYRHGFRFAVTGPPAVRSGAIVIPDGENKRDPYFGEVEVYRAGLAVQIPIEIATETPGRTALSVAFQGCADAGLCYPPVTQSFEVDFASEPGVPLRRLTADAALQVSAGGPRPPSTSLPFTRVLNTTALAALLADAARRSVPVVLDFYADWCIPCRTMEARTFSDPEVQKSLAGAVLLRADVTRNSAADAALLERFDLKGPPAILFFARNGAELERRRVVGFMDPAPFAAWARAAVR